MTTLHSEPDAVSLLTHLMQLDYAAIEGYHFASEHIESERYRAQLLAFKADHERHLRELEPVLRQFGGEPPDAGSKIRVLPGMVTIADRRGDEAILLAMQNNEQGTGQGYQDALDRAPDEARDIIARGCDDEQRHVDWLNIALSELGASASYQGSAEPPRQGTIPPPT